MYKKNFKLAENLFLELDKVVSQNQNHYFKSRLTGFIAVSAVTVYELAVKEIFINFATKKHKILGNFTVEFFDKINGRIKKDNLRNDYLKKYGEKYRKKFDKVVKEKGDRILKKHREDIFSCYENIITWRHDFIHEGKTPTTATYEEVKKSYHYGKWVIHCLAEAMEK